MYARRGMATPSHCHRKKKEDIICRWGELAIQLWLGDAPFTVKINGEPVGVESGQTLNIPAGSRITLVPGVYHEFAPVSEECIIGEVSTANDDLNDNFFVNPDVGRYPHVEEDEAPLVRLLSDKTP